MPEKMFKCLKAIMLLSALGGCKITIGEVARWVEISPSTAKRHIEKLEKLGMVDCDYFRRGNNMCRDFFPTDFGTEFYDGGL